MANSLRVAEMHRLVDETNHDRLSLQLEATQPCPPRALTATVTITMTTAMTTMLRGSVPSRITKNSSTIPVRLAASSKEAAEYDKKHGETQNQLIEEIRSRLGFIGVEWVEEGGDRDEKQDAEEGPGKGRTVRLLDYACGTGLVSRALAPYTTQCVGIDLSENMVATYNRHAEHLGLTPSKMRAYHGNLCDSQDEDPAAFASPEFTGFDVAAVGLGFHHFDDPALAARRLAARLKPGGVLVILDFLPHAKPDPSHPATSTVTHHGFSEEHIRGIFEQAGVGKDFALVELETEFHFIRPDGSEMHRRIFIARGTKA
ncbi:hypothetical protein VTJ49DRAFT_5563 [Mycothermus thermophilus]|uniref:S-adenosyl-L-methionine-dependent methyltransferase n=1 Tax=Humicola insolens TaxID=85995 RepID=A0ABR3V4B3_HUMIN